MTTPDLLLHNPHSFDGDPCRSARPVAEAVTVRHGVSRLVCDPERFERDEGEEMAGIGMGMLYTRTHTGDPARPLRRELIGEESAEASLQRGLLPGVLRAARDLVIDRARHGDARAGRRR